MYITYKFVLTEHYLFKIKSLNRWPRMNIQSNGAFEISQRNLQTLTHSLFLLLLLINALPPELFEYDIHYLFNF